MNRYDWSWMRPYDRGYRSGPGPMRGYGQEYGWGGREWWGGPEGSWSWEGGPPRGPMQPWRGPRRGRGYDRGIYGEAYPGYGGYPGGWTRGLHYGGRGYDAGYGPRGGAPRPSGGWERDRGYEPVREPFIPEIAYQRHPELSRHRRHPTDEWPRAVEVEYEEPHDDEEIRDAVRQSLFNDDWIDAARIEVEVSDQVVTLRGEVDDYLEARYAWDDAWEAEGVRGVINQLTVRTTPHETHGDVLPQTAGGKKKKGSS